jgi:NAD(P)H-flavin reductase
MGESNPKIDIKQIIFKHMEDFMYLIWGYGGRKEKLLLRESELQKLLKSVIHLTETLTPTASKTEGEVQTSIYVPYK